MSILVLGSSKWKAGYAPRHPPPIDPINLEGLTTAAIELSSPLAIRAAMAWYLREVMGVRATLMELHATKPKETHTSLFHRIVQERRVDGYFVFWPFGAQRAGLDVEIGFLLGQFAQGHSPDVRLFFEAGKHPVAQVRDGHLEVLEKGSRTRYYGDLAEYGASLVEWPNYSELWEALDFQGRDWLNQT